MRQKGYILFVVMVFVSIMALSLLSILAVLFNDKALLRNEVVSAAGEQVVFENVSNIERNRDLYLGCQVEMRSPYGFANQTDAWWQLNGCRADNGLSVVLAQGAVDAHRYIMVDGVPKRAMQAAVVLQKILMTGGSVVWLSQWVVASREDAVIDHESVLVVPHREQLECLRG